VKSFAPFLSRLVMIRDPRRAEGKLYQLPYILLFSILAIVTGANSYRGVRTFIKTHLKRLHKAFKIDWKRPPAHTAIRYILQGLDPADVETVFRAYAANLNSSEATAGKRILAFDGKVLKGSFDAFNDVKARQMLSAFAVDRLALNHKLTLRLPQYYVSRVIGVARTLYRQRQRRGGLSSGPVTGPARTPGSVLMGLKPVNV
jgi:hypothetical protein